MKLILQNHVIHMFLIFLTLSPILCISVRAQSDNGEDAPRNPGTNLYPYSRLTSSLAIILAVLITSVFFMIFFFIYIRHCSSSSITTGHFGRSRRAAVAVPRGLDATVIDTFPTFSYLEVKDHKIGKGALECAVCLNEFEDDETLRLIPKCDHVFHPECIDAWLDSHVTCPVCRADLVPQPGDEPAWVPDLPVSNEEIHDNSNLERNSLRSEEIAMEAGDVENQLQEMKGMNRNLSFQYPNRPPKGPIARNMSFQYPKRPPKAPVNRNLSFGNLNRTPRVGLNRRPQRSLSMSQRMFNLVKFGRSKSMGNILVQPGEDVERFTLRLPSEVRKEVMNRALLNRTRSFATTPMDPNSRNDKVDRSNRQVKSDRWVFFTRALSMNIRSPRPVTEIGESSSSKVSKSKTLEQLRSFNCLEPRDVRETGYPS